MQLSLSQFATLLRIVSSRQGADPHAKQSDALFQGYASQTFPCSPANGCRIGDRSGQGDVTRDSGEIRIA